MVAILTGKQGLSPGYDPLQFAIQEAHARGLELHAWFNPFRAAVSAGTKLAANHVGSTHPDWVRRFGSQLWLDPGEPAAREYVLSVILDVVRRYDIDGVHIDDYFYPYPLKRGDAWFPDDATWQRHGAASGMSTADWRRDNINKFVEAMYREVKRAKPSVRVGISPFGIWRPGVPATIEAELDAYAQLFADPRKWLAEGWCDYLAPQLYWSISPPKQSFPVLLDWWRAQSRGRPVWPGLASDRIGASRPRRRSWIKSRSRAAIRKRRADSLEHEGAAERQRRHRGPAPRRTLRRENRRTIDACRHHDRFTPYFAAPQKMTSRASFVPAAMMAARSCEKAPSNCRSSRRSNVGAPVFVSIRATPSPRLWTMLRPPGALFTGVNRLSQVRTQWFPENGVE
jgi:uncharacterized lipoprotein YddW (UPF0748 family)